MLKHLPSRQAATYGLVAIVVAFSIVASVVVSNIDLRPTFAALGPPLP